MYVCPQMLVHRIGPGMVQQMQRPCSHCSGRGEIMNGKGRASRCVYGCTYVRTYVYLCAYIRMYV